MRPTNSRTTASGGTPSRVELDQLAGLVARVDDQPVAGFHHLLLADDAAQRLRGVAVGEREVLDLGQGVRGVHERHPPPLGGQPADLPGQPVVGVHDVVPAGLVRGLDPQDAGGQGAQLGRQVLLGQPLERTGGDVAHGDARRELDDGRQVAAGGAGEDLHLDAEGGQPLAGLDDVDVHATGVAGARLLERRGVHGQHRHAPRVHGRQGHRRTSLSRGSLPRSR
jgi:hypothetical protein